MSERRRRRRRQRRSSGPGQLEALGTGQRDEHAADQVDLQLHLAGDVGPEQHRLQPVGQRRAGVQRVVGAERPARRVQLFHLTPTKKRILISSYRNPRKLHGISLISIFRK